jgi:RNA polymerase sigma factor (sigma-70 family)
MSTKDDFRPGYIVSLLIWRLIIYDEPSEPWELYADTTTPVHLEEDEKQAVRDAVAALEPPKYGAIIKAYFWEGKSYQAIAKEYDTTTGTIGTWIRRAKAQLKEKLA